MKYRTLALDPHVFSTGSRHAYAVLHHECLNPVGARIRRAFPPYTRPALAVTKVTTEAAVLRGLIASVGHLLVYLVWAGYLGVCLEPEGVVLRYRAIGEFPECPLPRPVDPPPRWRQGEPASYGARAAETMSSRGPTPWTWRNSVAGARTWRRTTSRMTSSSSRLISSRITATSSLTASRTASHETRQAPAPSTSTRRYWRSRCARSAGTSRWRQRWQARR